MGAKFGHIVTEATRAKISASRKGKNLGHEVSEETRRKIGEANSAKLKGQVISAEVRANMSAAKKKFWTEKRADKEWLLLHSAATSQALKGKYVGNKASNWRGGTTQFMRNDTRNAAWRSQVLKRDNYTCQICDHYGGDMHIDHIKSWAEHKELRFDVSNGRTLCRPCHYYVTFKRKMPTGSRWGIKLSKEII